MKKTLEVKIHGLKCDNPKCDYNNPDIKVEDYKKFVNSKCPKCGQILLTLSDFNAVQSLLLIENLINSKCPKRKDDDEFFTAKLNMNGDGNIHFTIK